MGWSLCCVSYTLVVSMLHIDIVVILCPPFSLHPTYNQRNFSVARLWYCFVVWPPNVYKSETSWWSLRLCGSKRAFDGGIWTVQKTCPAGKVRGWFIFVCCYAFTLAGVVLYSHLTMACGAISSWYSFIFRNKCRSGRVSESTSVAIHGQLCPKLWSQKESTPCGMVDDVTLQ